MNAANLCRNLINEIIVDYDLMIPRLTTSSAIDQDILLEVFKAVVPVEASDKSNGQTDQSDSYERMLTILSESLYIDLSHISAESLAAGDLKHTLAFLEILVAIKRYVHGKSDHDDQEDRHNATFTIGECGGTNDQAKEAVMNAKRPSVCESECESCSICFCHEMNGSESTRATEAVTRAKNDDDNGTGKVRVRRSRSPQHRYVDARMKKKLLLTGAREDNCRRSSSTATASSSATSNSSSCASCHCSSHQLVKRMNQVLHLNEEVKCLEREASTSKCASTSASPDFIVNPCILSPGTKVQLERLFKSHQAFQRNIRVQVEKVQDSRQLLLQQLSMHSKTGNVNATSRRSSSLSCCCEPRQRETLVRQQVNHQVNHNCTHQAHRDTSMIMSCVNPSLYTGSNYQRDLRSRLARLTREIKEKERQLTSRKLKTQSDLQRTIVKCATSQVNRSKRELMAAREYVLRRNLQQMKKDQLYLQSLDQLFDDKTSLMCSKAVALTDT